MSKGVQPFFYMEITDIKGIGKKNAEHLETLGIRTVYDLADHLPRAYLDFSRLCAWEGLVPGNYALICAVLVSVGSLQRPRRGLNYFRASVMLSGKKMRMVWFNQPYYREKLEEGREYLFWGKVQQDGSLLQMVNPSFEPKEDLKKLTGVMPVYRTKNLIAQSTMNKLILQAVDLLCEHSAIPERLRFAEGWPDLYEAYVAAHRPRNLKEAASAIKRLALEDSVQQLAAFRHRKHLEDNARILWYTESAEGLPMPAFTLNDGQQNAIREIIANLQGGQMMNRLLQGDVGSGKTVVAMIAMAYAVKNGYQALLIAPTEILARQHYDNACMFFKDAGISVAFLSASAAAAEKRQIQSMAEAGLVDILISTHAVIGARYAFKNLSLIVIDEAHRFGVAQKAALFDKGLRTDCLSLSATPIPRSIRLIEYGDLDVTELVPRYESPVSTHIVHENKREGLFDFISKECEKGGKAYVVCPLIEDQEGVLINSVKGIEKMFAERFGGIAAVLHGGMKSSQKEEVIRRFHAGQVRVLIATSIVEVGIDDPDASIIAILNAERFGLATLHQLRGRVGRRGQKSYCFLHAGAESERLEILKRFSDGLSIAEADLKLRGCGDFLGKKQSGGVSKYAQKIDHTVIETAKRVLDQMTDDELQAAAAHPRVQLLSDSMENIILN